MSLFNLSKTLPATVSQHFDAEEHRPELQDYQKRYEGNKQMHYAFRPSV